MTLSDDIARLAGEWALNASKLEAQRDDPALRFATDACLRARMAGVAETCRDHAFDLVTLLYRADGADSRADARTGGTGG